MVGALRSFLLASNLSISSMLCCCLQFKPPCYIHCLLLSFFHVICSSFVVFQFMFKLMHSNFVIEIFFVVLIILLI
jgi:hypothetical protein